MKIIITTTKTLEIKPSTKKKSSAPQKPAVQSNSTKTTVIVNPK